MTELLDGGGLRIAGYFLACGVSLVVGWREWRSPERSAHTLWFLIALLLLAMGVARAGGLGDVLADLGREQAERTGWYVARHAVQVVAVIGICVVGAVPVVMIWRDPSLRRRHLPAVVAGLGLVCFAAIRAVSLHRIDTLLYRRDVADVRVVAIVELGLLAAMIAAARWSIRTVHPPR